MKKIVSVAVAILLIITVFTSFTASAVFIPSPGSNNGSEIVPEDVNGKKYNAVIVKGTNWDEVIEAVPDGNIIITRYDDIDSAPDEVDKDAFRKAKQQLADAKSLNDLNSQIAKNAILMDFFDLTVTGKYADMMAQGNSLKISFNVGKLNGNFKVMMLGPNGWEVIEHVRYADGIATMLLSHSGPVAFVVEPEAGDTSDTSDKTPIVGYVVVAVCSLGCIIALSSKRRTAK